MNLTSEPANQGASRRAFVVDATARVAAPSAMAEETKTDLLFVQTAKRMSFERAANRLTLTGVGPVTLFLTDRPERIAGNMSTAKFVPFGGEGPDRFPSVPPNADISLVEDGKPRRTVVALREPELSGENPSSPVRVMRGEMPERDAEASVFIDVIGRPLTPGSFAGTDRGAAIC